MSIAAEPQATRPDGRLPTNPFSTRFVRPGMVEPLDAEGRPIDLAALAARLCKLGCGAIEGSHGHGKTTLLAALAAELTAVGHHAPLIKLRTAADAGGAIAAILRAPRAGRGRCDETPASFICIDSWECLGWRRVLVRLAARARGCGLLVTSHRRTGLPVLWTCGTSRELLSAIVHSLPKHDGRITAGDVVAAFVAHGGNLRESLFFLYDRFECRVRM